MNIFMEGKKKVQQHVGYSATVAFITFF